MMRNLKTNLARIMPLMAVFFFVGCTTSKTLMVNTWQPPKVQPSKEMKRIGIIDRSYLGNLEVAETENDKLLQVEKKWLANKGVTSALTGLKQALIADGRFELVTVLPKSPAEEAVTGHLPEPLSWETIDQLGQDQELDGIFSLAYYNASSTIETKKAMVEERGMLRQRGQAVGTELTLETLIQNGWRIYDIRHHSIIDEHNMEEVLTSKAKGSGPYVALQAIAIRKDSVLDRNRGYGEAFGKRLSAQQEMQERIYYTPLKKGFAAAKKAVKDGRYQVALNLWEAEVFQEKLVLRTKAAHNLAVLNEYLGNLPEALYWAKKSYAFAPTDEAQAYVENLVGQCTVGPRPEEQPFPKVDVTTVTSR